MGVIDQNINNVNGTLATLADNITGYIPIAITALIVLGGVIIAYKILDYILKKGIQKFKPEDQGTILKMWHYGFAFLALVILLLTFSGNLGLTGVTLGLFSAALGFSLQRPITGIVAWLMILVKKPFKVGDRVIIENLKGDIEDITMFYIVLKEVGGLFESENYSGRHVLIPTSVLFEKPITNYRFINQFVLKEITASVTYESDLKKAQEIMMEIAHARTSKYVSASKMEPHTRAQFKASSIDIHLRFPVPPTKMDKISHEITEQIHEKFRAEPTVEFAYPHMQVVFKKGTKLEMGK